MKRLIACTPAPKKQRIVIYVNNRGSFTALTTGMSKNAFLLQDYNIKQRGFTKIMEINLPHRYHMRGNGYNPALQYAYMWIVLNFGA